MRCARETRRHSSWQRATSADRAIGRVTSATCGLEACLCLFVRRARGCFRAHNLLPQPVISLQCLSLLSLHSWVGSAQAQAQVWTQPQIRDSDRTVNSAGRAETRTSLVWTRRGSSSPVTRATPVPLSRNHTKRAVRRAGYVLPPTAVCGTLNETLPAQIDYFNKRRVLAEQQRDVLAQVNTQAADAKRR